MRLIEEISSFLQLPAGYIRKLAKSASYKYKEYTIDKRDGGKRTIYQPSKELKAVQRFLLYFIIEEFIVHDAVFSYRESLNIVDHAEKHKKNNYLLRMDLLDFFPSIKKEDIINYFNTIKRKKKKYKDWDSDDIDLFCKLVCKDERLTVGAPSSPALSNAICYEMDSKLSRLAQDNDAIYTSAMSIVI